MLIYLYAAVHIEKNTWLHNGWNGNWECHENIQNLFASLRTPDFGILFCPFGFLLTFRNLKAWDIALKTCKTAPQTAFMDLILLHISHVFFSILVLCGSLNVYQCWNYCPCRPSKTGGIKTFRSLVFSLLGVKVPSGTNVPRYVPGNFHSWKSVCFLTTVRDAYNTHTLGAAVKVNEKI